MSLQRDALWWHTPNEGKRGWRAQRDFKALGSKAGVPDIMLVHQSKAYAIELKAAKGRLTPAQNQFHASLTQAGVPVATCRSERDVVDQLQAWGLLQRKVILWDEDK